MVDDHLEVMLTEYKFLRQHIDNNFNHQIRLFAIIVSALGVIYGIIFAYEQARDLFLLIPAIIFPLGLRAQYSTYGIDEIGKYLEELEVKIWSNISNTKYQDWEGWQNHWATNKLESKILAYDVLPKWLLFLGIPMSVSVFYSYIIISKFIQSGCLAWGSNLNPCFHLFLALVYISIIADSFIYFILYKKIYKEEIYKLIKDMVFTNNEANKMSYSLKGPFLIIATIIPLVIIGSIIPFPLIKTIFPILIQIIGIVLISLWNVWTSGTPRLKVAVWLSSEFGDSPRTAFQNFFVSLGLGFVLSGLVLQLLHIIL